MCGARLCRFNSISAIQDNSLAGLKKAELLMLHSNDIQHLQDEVFRDMKSLQVSKVKLQQSAANRSVSQTLTDGILQIGKYFIVYKDL